MHLRTLCHIKINNDAVLSLISILVSAVQTVLRRIRGGQAEEAEKVSGRLCAPRWVADAFGDWQGPLAWYADVCGGLPRAAARVQQRQGEQVHWVPRHSCFDSSVPVAPAAVGVGKRRGCPVGLYPAHGTD